MTEVPIELAELPALKKLNLSNNKIANVPPEMWTLKALQVPACPLGDVCCCNELTFILRE